MSQAENARVNETSPDKAEDIIEAANAVADAAAPPLGFQGIAILGSNPATVAQAPFGDPKWLIYACSPHNIEHRTLPRVNQWFEVHEPATHPTRNYEYLRRLEDNNVAQNPMHAEAIWVRDEQFAARGRDFRMYPQAELERRWGPFFFTSSIAFMMAKALVDCEQMKIPAIGLWGIMQASPNEYTYQRPGIQYFIQRAVEMGIKVLAPEESRLFEPQDVEF